MLWNVPANHLMDLQSSLDLWSLPSQSGMGAHSLSSVSVRFSELELLMQQSNNELSFSTNPVILAVFAGCISSLEACA